MRLFVGIPFWIAIRAVGRSRFSVYKVGDTYPFLRFDDGYGGPLDLRGARLTYAFAPDSRRAKVRRGVALRPKDAARGVFYPPRPRTSGLCEITIRFPDGQCVLSPTLIRFER